MKSEQEFLDCMWDSISETEYEEMQKQLAKIRNTAIIKKKITTYLFLFFVYSFVLFIVLWAKIPDSFSVVFPFALIALTTGYFLDSGSYA